MSFQFANNWPYSNTGFPTMIEHVDPVNNEYFAGLMTELGRIEYYLGIHPQGGFENVRARLDDIDNVLGDNVEEGFDDVKDKLENHGHTGGYDGKQLVVPAPGIWEEVDFVGTLGSFSIVPFEIGGSTAGFAYYDLIYLGPCEDTYSIRYIQCFNTTTDQHTWQASAINRQPSGAIWTGEYGIFTLTGAPGRIMRFNPETWEQIVTVLDSGQNYPRHLCKPDSNVWFPTFTTPAKIMRYNPANHVFTSWDMDGGENECTAVCTDGTYIWTCCNTTPVKLIRFKISDKTHTAYIITGFLPEIKYMFYHNGMVYMFSNNTTVQWARFNPAILGFQRWEPDFPEPFRAGAKVNTKHILTLMSSGHGYLALFDPEEFEWRISRDHGDIGSMTWITFANNHVVWFGGTFVDREAPITIV